MTGLEAEPGQLRHRTWRIVAFVLVCAVCVASASVAVLHSGDSTSGRPLVEADPAALADLGARPHAVLVDTRLGPGYGLLGLVDPTGGAEIVHTGLSCDRVDMARDRGVCLRSHRGVLTTYEAVVFDDQFQELSSYDLPGVPSRTRVSPDGTLGAWTTFVAGDSYLTRGFSTRTHIVNLRTGEELGDLEQFSVIKDGEPFSEIDFNYWGVTFAPDQTTFYATLQTGGHQYLVRGNLANRRLTVLRDGIECPSLSPDGTRLVFKKRVEGDFGRIEWRLSVLELASLEAHELAETRSVDDQAQWLDDSTVTYALPRADSGTPTKDTWAVLADGSGSPRLLIEGAWSFNPAGW